MGNTIKISEKHAQQIFFGNHTIYLGKALNSTHCTWYLLGPGYTDSKIQTLRAHGKRVHRKSNKYCRTQNKIVTCKRLKLDFVFEY